MQIVQNGTSGTMESSDIMVTVEAGNGGLSIDLNSIVDKQYGASIKKLIEETLLEFGIQEAHVVAVDRGALDCTIRARVKTAIYRACNCTDYKWGGK